MASSAMRSNTGDWPNKFVKSQIELKIVFSTLAKNTGSIGVDTWMSLETSSVMMAGLCNGGVSMGESRGLETWTSCTCIACAPMAGIFRVLSSSNSPESTVGSTKLGTAVVFTGSELTVFKQRGFSVTALSIMETTVEPTAVFSTCTTDFEMPSVTVLYLFEVDTASFLFCANSTDSSKHSAVSGTALSLTSVSWTTVFSETSTTLPSRSDSISISLVAPSSLSLLICVGSGCFTLSTVFSVIWLLLLLQSFSSTSLISE